MPRGALPSSLLSSLTRTSINPVSLLQRKNGDRLGDDDRRLELEPADETMRPDQVADRAREAIIRKNAGSTITW